MSKFFNHPLVLLIGVVASVIGILVFVTGKNDIQSIIKGDKFTGVIEGNYYKNPFFGFKIAVPPDWCHDHDQNRKEYTALLNLSKCNKNTNDDYGILTIGYENLEHSTTSSAEEYLSKLKKKFETSNPPIATSNIEHLNIDGRDFYSLDYNSDVHTTGFSNTKVFATFHKRFALFIIISFSGNSESDLNGILGTFTYNI